MRVFIESVAGSKQKHIYNEKTLLLKEIIQVTRNYPYPYGFIIDTNSGDGANLDCFVLTKKKLLVGEIYDVLAIGYMEQFETRNQSTIEDHNILATFPDEHIELTIDIKQKIVEFISYVWDHRAGKKVEVGQFFNKQKAEALLTKCATDNIILDNE